MIYKKEEFFNWFQPSGRSGQGKMGPVIRVYKTKTRSTITISWELLDKFKIQPWDSGLLKIAISFDKDNPFIVFNPVKGVPFVLFKRYKSAKSFTYNSKEMVAAFAERFNLEKRCAYHDFEVEKFQIFNDMIFYRLSLLHSVPCNDKE